MAELRDDVPANVSPADVAQAEQLRAAYARITSEIGKLIVGQQEVIEQLMIAILARGHCLLEGVPGLAKTLMIHSLADTLSLSFNRIQFTPDLMPSDITGTEVIQEDPDTHERRFKFLRGPVFANVILADEINRTPPKTQAALLQAMQERRVTVGTETHELPDPFQVFATRNPIEQEGTYQLPEAQLDRFLLEIHVGYPSENEEQQIARKTTSADFGKEPIPHVLKKEDLRALQALVPRMPITDEAVSLAVTLTRKTRPQNGSGNGPKTGPTDDRIEKYVRFGAGPRGSQALVLAAKARAALRGHAAADVEDIRALLVPVLRHRLVMSYRAESDGVTEEDLLSQI